MNLQALELGVPTGKPFPKPAGHSLSSHPNIATSKGAIALADALAVNKTLEYLGLSKVSLCDSGSPDEVMRHFGSALSANRTLKSLNVSGNNLGNFGATQLFKGLTENFCL